MDPLPSIEPHLIPFLRNESKVYESRLVPFSFREGFFLRRRRVSLDGSQAEFPGLLNGHIKQHGPEVAPLFRVE